MPKNCWKKMPQQIEGRAVTVNRKVTNVFPMSEVQVSFVVVLWKLSRPDTSWCFYPRASLVSEISGNKVSALGGKKTKIFF